MPFPLSSSLHPLSSSQWLHAQAPCATLGPACESHASPRCTTTSSETQSSISNSFFLFLHFLSTLRLQVHLSLLQSKHEPLSNSHKLLSYSMVSEQLTKCCVTQSHLSWPSSSLVAAASVTQLSWLIYGLLHKPHLLTTLFLAFSSKKLDQVIFCPFLDFMDFVIIFFVYFILD